MASAVAAPTKIMGKITVALAGRDNGMKFTYQGKLPKLKHEYMTFTATGGQGSNCRNFETGNGSCQPLM